LIFNLLAPNFVTTTVFVYAILFVDVYLSCKRVHGRIPTVKCSCLRFYGPTVLNLLRDSRQLLDKTLILWDPNMQFCSLMLALRW